MNILLVFCALLAGSRAAAPQVRLGRTVIAGSQLHFLQQDFFGGIPFASAPVGNLRLQPPVLKTDLLVDHFDATSFGPACIQPRLPAASMSEDCLTINVLRPSGTSLTSRLPVMVWTYGGGFQRGASSTYNGSAIVAQSVARGTPLIYVNFNYRLGPLGFPQGKEAKRRNSLNLGLRDQMTALEWVQRNIAYFGGDNSKVTVSGESAGSIMTAILFLGQRIEEYARAAIFESGSAAAFLAYNAELHESDWQNFVLGVSSCASLTMGENAFPCLQSADSSEIIQGFLAAVSETPAMFGFVPTIDGSGGVFPDFPSKLFAKGDFARLPFIAGTNQDEGTEFVNHQINSESAVFQLITANFSPPVVPPDAFQSGVKKIIELYPDSPVLGSPFNTGNDTFGLSSFYKQAAAIVGDLVFQSLRRLWMRTASFAGVKTWGYLFTQPLPNYPPAFGAELLYVYGDMSGQNASAVQLSRMMIDYWVSFVTSLDPNDGRGIARPRWEQYTPQRQELIQLNAENLTMIPDDYRAEQIDYINSDPLVWLH